MKGKFNSVNDEAVYAQVLEGFGETVGSVDTLGAVFTLLPIDEDIDWSVPFTSTTRIHAGTYIIKEDSQGFVTVTGYAFDDEEDQEMLKRDWETILEEVAQFEDEDTEQ